MVHFVSSSFFEIRAFFLFRQAFLREFIMQEPPFFVKIKQESLALKVRCIQLP